MNENGDERRMNESEMLKVEFHSGRIKSLNGGNPSFTDAGDVYNGAAAATESIQLLS